MEKSPEGGGGQEKPWEATGFEQEKEERTMKVKAWKKYRGVLECWGLCIVEGTRWRRA